MEKPDYLKVPINILIVDDRPENINALKAVLSDESYNLIMASSGAEALSCVLKYDFALILLDVFMGEMDGYEVASLIKGRKKSRHIPIIFLTAMAKDIDHIFKAYSIGAVDYIQKPLEPHIVRAKVGVFAELFRNQLWIRHQAEVIRKQELNQKEYELREVKRAGERRFQDLVEGINHGFVWSSDPQNLTFTYISPRAELILGFPLEQWRTERGFWQAHLHPDDRDAVLEAFKMAQMGRDIGIDHRFLTVEGSEVWLHTGVRLARRGEGVGLELRGLSVDITHLKRIETALRESVQVRDEFLSIASHELKTPLTPLKLQVQQLQKMIEKGAEIDAVRLRKLIDVWTRQLDRLTLLIDDLLDVSRISGGRLNMNPTDVDLSQVVSEIAERYRESACRSGCEITVHIPEKLPGSLDRPRIEQVLINLISNAIKYAPKSEITISLSTRDNKAFLSVKDCGPGISTEDQGRIFDRFERAVSSASAGGLGLGLYISRKIIEAHGGAIRVESEPGKGANFIIELPLRQDGTQEIAA